MTPWMNEGFFADIVVLVEGEDDRAVILGVARSMGHDFDRDGITVIPCFGKTNLDRPLAIFRQLSIPLYVVWDGDQNSSNARPEDNHRLLRIHGKTIHDWPCFVADIGACFKIDMENTVSHELGNDIFEQLLSQFRNELGIPKRSQALKNPMVIQRILEEAAKFGKTSASLRAIVESIVALKNRTEA